MKPTREHATHNAQSYFVTSNTWERRPLFKNPAWAELFLDVLQSYRHRAYLLHDYVLMPDHFDVILTPAETLERAVQCIKGGFSFRVRKELQSSMEVWQRGFSDHRLRGLADYRQHVEYVRNNPVNRRLVEIPEEYPYCSARDSSGMDELPASLRSFADCEEKILAGGPK